MSGLPPLFKQGASARARVLFFAFISVGLLAVDSRMHSLDTIRKAVGTALYPIQMLALMPRDGAAQAGDYFTSLSTLERDNKALRLQQVQSAQLLQQERLLAVENNQLRNLLGMQQKLGLKSVVGEILYDARDPFTRKVVLNRGTQQDVAPGQPVIDDLGIVGQITRVFPFTSEVTLLTDKDQAIPVQVLRNGLRSIAYGRGQSGALDLRFMAANADIKKDDILVTSGIDGVYPAGLAVATVTRVEIRSSDAFAHIVCAPIAGVDRHKQLLILLTDPNVVARPPAESAPSKTDKSGKTQDATDKNADKPADKAADKPADKVTEKAAAAPAAPVTPAASVVPAKPAAPATNAVPATAAAAPAPAAKPAASTPSNKAAR